MGKPTRTTGSASDRAPSAARQPALCGRLQSGRLPRHACELRAQHRPRPAGRVRLRIGWRYCWVTGVAAALPDDDALARQRHIIAWHSLRALNAINVRALCADLLTVHVRLIDDSWSGRIKPSLSGVRLLYASECPASSLRSSG
jgi:hypothetical protein